MVRNKDRFTKYLDRIRDDLVLKVGEVELSYSIAPEKVSELPRITNPKETYDYLKHIWEPDISAIERAKVLFLNHSNRLLGWYNLSSSSEVGTVISIKRTVMIACNIISCTGVIYAHNHPSGNREPSEHDKRSSKVVGDALKLIEIRLVDNLIITPETYYSFANERTL